MWHVFPLDPALNVVLAALLGLVAGSWLSVVAHRLPRMMEREWRTAMREEDGGAESGYGLWRPAWHCPSCQAALRGWRAVPLAGWLLQRGRCGHCGQPIGLRYPMLELAA
ncbi:prepilin peptidase, partial [Bordetella pertussis]